jgi:hypothetical protein
MVTIPKKVSDRLSKEIGKFQRILKTAKDRDVNESDTVTIIVDMLASVFGFDKFLEITSEQAIRGTFCDLAVKLGGKLKYLIEVKAVGLNLKDNHLRQAIGYGATHGISWVVLTNGINWEVYKIRFEKPVDYDLVCTFDFLELNRRKQDDQRKVFLLCKEGIEKAVIDEFFDHVQIVNRFMVGAITVSEPVVSIIRRELRKISPNVRASDEEIKNILTTGVLKRDIVEGEAADAALKRVNKQLRKQVSKRIEKVREPLNVQNLPIE